MKHHFPVMASETDKFKLVNNVEKLSTWMSRVDKLAEDNSLAFDRDKFVGDAFEHLVECIITWGRSDKAINCVNVAPTEYDAPGVDLIGVAHDMVSVHTIQCKYRSNTIKDLTESQDHIAMFPSTSLTNYKAKYMTIWTTANSLHRVLDEAWDNQVNTMGAKEIRKLIDSNVAFWQFYSEDLLKNTRKST
jgi:hypothetical protein